MHYHYFNPFKQSTSTQTMDRRELLRADEFSDTFLRRRRRDQIVQNVCLIWLDNNINTNESNYCSTITQLRAVINNIKTFNDPNQCISFLKDISSGNIIMIISEQLCHDIVPVIHNFTQVQTIYIFCDNKTEHESLD